MATLPLIKVAFRGQLTAGQRWSFGLTAVPANAPNAGDLATYLTDIDSALSTWVTASGGFQTICSSDTTIDQLQAYHYPAGARASDLSAAKTVSHAGTVARIVPYQCAVVMSLRTGVPGRHNRGRVYIPLGVSSSTSAGQLASTVTTNAANVFGTFLATVGALTVAGGACFLVVGSPESTATPQVINEVIVDSVIDTQRRRTDKVVAATTATSNVFQ